MGAEDYIYGVDEIAARASGEPKDPRPDWLIQKLKDRGDLSATSQVVEEPIKHKCPEEPEGRGLRGR